MPDDQLVKFDVVVIGGGAAGLMCAITAGARGRRVLLLEKMPEVGKKILISGGGRCNFTNIGAAPDRYVSDNTHFCKSALRQYSQHDFIKLVEKHGIAYHEKKLGQLFCDDSARQITEMLLAEAEAAGVHVWCDAPAKKVTQNDGGFSVALETQNIQCESVVIAAGGLSIPKIGATDFAHRTANSFDLELTELKPGLVPFTFDAKDMERFQGLTGVSADVVVSIRKVKFRENLLFTHKGVSGPAILQISSYWNAGDQVRINFLPDHDLFELLKDARKNTPKSTVKKQLQPLLAKKIVDKLLEPFAGVPELGNCSDKVFRQITAGICEIMVAPNGTEGYRKAEVTVGGVKTSEIRSKTMEVKKVPGLYYIGEAVDMTGYLGGYNFQWAWSSGYVAGQNA